MLQILETWFTGLAAVAACVAAIGAISAAIYAKASIADNRSFNKTRLTVEFLESRPLCEAVAQLNNFIMRHGTMERARNVIQQKLTTKAFSSQEIIDVSDHVAGPLGYAAALYTENVLNKELLLQRLAPFIAGALYVYEDVLKNMLLSGSVEESLVILGREALAYYKAIPREYDPTPELTNFTI